MNCIGDFVVECVHPAGFGNGEEVVGISWDDYPLFDFCDGYLWLWRGLPKSINLDIDESFGTLMIVNVDNME